MGQVLNPFETFIYNSIVLENLNRSHEYLSTYLIFALSAGLLVSYLVCLNILVVFSIYLTFKHRNQRKSNSIRIEALV